MTLIINKLPIDQNSEDSKPRHRNTRQGKRKTNGMEELQRYVMKFVYSVFFFLGVIYSLCALFNNLREK
jgi:hypothetical protein